MALIRFALSLLAGLAAANPAPAPEFAYSRQCSLHKHVQKTLSVCATASSYCQSYLHSTVTTVTKTSTTATSIVSSIVFTLTESSSVPSTSTRLSGKAVTTEPTVIFTVPVTSTSVQGVSMTGSIGSAYSSAPSDTYSPIPPPQAKSSIKPRNVNAAATRSCGVAFLPRAAISIGCHCYLGPRITSTVYVTDTDIMSLTATTTTPHTIVKATVTDPSITVTDVPSSTVSETTVVKASTPAMCGNQGLNWAYYEVAKYNLYNSPDPQVNVPVPNPGFSSAYYKDVTPNYSGVTSDIQGWKSTHYMQYFSIYGHRLPDFSFVLDHTAYLYAPVTGNYTFNIIKVDNLANVWTGSVAYSGWDDSNISLAAMFGQTDTSASLPLVAGTYTPVRIMFGAGRNPNSFIIQVTAPDGKIILGSDDSAAEYWVTGGCGGLNSPPPFPPFGQET